MALSGFIASKVGNVDPANRSPEAVKPGRKVAGREDNPGIFSESTKTLERGLRYSERISFWHAVSRIRQSLLYPATRVAERTDYDADTGHEEESGKPDGISRSEGVRLQHREPGPRRIDPAMSGFPDRKFGGAFFGKLTFGCPWGTPQGNPVACHRFPFPDVAVGNGMPELHRRLRIVFPLLDLRNKDLAGNFGPRPHRLRPEETARHQPHEHAADHDER